MSSVESTPRCQCADCGVLSPVAQWGFVLLTREHGWTVTTVTVMGEGKELRDGVEWRCPLCSRKRSASSGGSRSKNTSTHSNDERRGASPARANLRVLLVDDDALVRRAMSRLIAQYEVIAAENPRIALDVLDADSDFDAIVSDVKMPGMSGVEFATVVCDRWPDLSRRFVFVTGSPDEAEELIGLLPDRSSNNWPCMLCKPVTRHDLTGAIETVAGRASSRSGTYRTIVSTHRGSGFLNLEAK